MKKRFAVLQIVSTILKILGIVTAALAVLGGLITFVMSFVGGDLFNQFGMPSDNGVLAGLLGAFMIVIFGGLSALFLYGYGELIMLLISMEDSTFRTVKLLEEVTSEEPAVEEKAK